MQYQPGRDPSLSSSVSSAGERMITEGGGMAWMSPNMKMETTSNGGLGRALGRMFFRREDVPEHLYRPRAARA